MPTFAYCASAPGKPIEAQLRKIRRSSALTEAESSAPFLDGEDVRGLPWFERAGGRALLARLSPGDRVVVATGAAICTRARDMVAVADLLEDRGITLVMLREKCTLAPGSMELKAFRAMMQALHQMNTSHRSEAITLGLRAKRARGGRHCNYPGYGRRWLGRRGHERLVDDPDEQRVIARIKDWHARGFTTEEVFQHLRARQVWTRAGTVWTRDRIRRVARAPVGSHGVDDATA